VLDIFGIIELFTLLLLILLLLILVNDFYLDPLNPFIPEDDSFNLSRYRDIKFYIIIFSYIIFYIL